MNWRNRKLKKNTLINNRWSILPPQFYESLLESVPNKVANYCNGKLKPFPSFLEVDYVFLPIPLDNAEWLIVRLELKTQELVLYSYEDLCVGDKYRKFIHPKLVKIQIYLSATLVNMQYWNKMGYPEKCMTFNLNEDYVVPQKSLTGNEAVYICMLMEHLVTDKPINITGDLKEICTKYRHKMAEQMYFWRCLRM